MRISDWSSDVCSSDLGAGEAINVAVFHRARLNGTRIAADIGFGEREAGDDLTARDPGQPCGLLRVGARHRSEEHTSELQSLMRISYAVLCLKKNTLSHTTMDHFNMRNQKHKIHIAN